MASATPAPLLSVGDRGHAVGHLQAALRRKGAAITIDGAFGPATRRTVLTLQRRLGLRPTGIAGATLYRRLGIPLTHLAHPVPSPVAPAPAPRPSPPPPAAAAPVAAPAETRSPYLRVFPVDAENSYTDDFGAARGQGAHEGTDVLAERGAPVVAVDAAVVDRLTRTERGLGGIYVWLRRADGTEYYYAHLDSIEPGLEEGTAVAAGQRIGRNGNTGDARYGAPHVHFEIHPSGGEPINPYEHLRAVDPKAAEPPHRH